MRKLIFYPTLVLIFSFCFSTFSKADALLIKNNEESSHPYMGFGTHIWHAELDNTQIQALKILKADFVRLGVSHWNNPEPTQRLKDLGLYSKAPPEQTRNLSSCGGYVFYS